jgi:hypothetical protein
MCGLSPTKDVQEYSNCLFLSPNETDNLISALDSHYGLHDPHISGHLKLATMLKR